MERRRNLPRLPPEHYRGFAAVHWSMTVEKRAQGWLTPLFHARFRELLVHTGVRYDLLCPVYCLMPDHVHLLLRGISPNADQRLAVEFLRRHANVLLAPRRLQRQPYDHVLRREDLGRGAFEAIAFYIAENPVRAELCAAAGEYPYTGAMMPGYPDLDVHRPGYWDVFWARHRELLIENGYEG